jgi:3-hydroxypropanoate dehydrogenase
MDTMLDDRALDRIFRKARTYRGSAAAWLDKPVSDAQLRAIHELARFGPTSANCQPARIVFVRSPEAKEKLRGALSPDNVAQTMAAPVTAIVGSDHLFHEQLGRLYRAEPDARSWFEGKPDAIAATAFRNASLQGAYLIIAARALGLDCGPMSGFRNDRVDELFFAGTAVKSNFLINIGYGDPAVLNPRDERYAFDEVCKIV